MLAGYDNGDVKMFDLRANKVWRGRVCVCVCMFVCYGVGGGTGGAQGTGECRRAHCALLLRVDPFVMTA